MGARQDRGIRRIAKLVFVAGVAYLGAFAATCAYHAFAPERGAPAAPQTETVVRDTTAVVRAVRDLATLETASFHMERVIDLRDRTTHLFGLVSIEDALLLVAAVDVVAGIDLSSMRDGDIVFDDVNKSATLILPAPTILSARLDNARTYVHARTTDALMQPGASLETRARQEAERSLRQAALDAGILDRARVSGARTVETLVRSLGFDHVEVRFRSE